MIVRLRDTSSSEILSALHEARRSLGTVSGLVFTLLISTDEAHYDATFDSILEAAQEHPSRILMVILDRNQTEPLNATVRTGEGYPGDVISLRIGGELCDHTDSVVLPLLLPESPVVAWWPYDAPENLQETSLGRLAERRIADSTTAENPVADLLARSTHHTRGNSDLAWTKLTLWRALLAASLDQFPHQVTSAQVETETDNASAELLAAWLQLCFNVEVTIKESDGPGITTAVLNTDAGPITIHRADGLSCDYLIPNQPPRSVAMKRRDIKDMIAEELRHMDDDPIYTEVVRVLLQRASQ